MYRSADDLVNQHWRVDCKGFVFDCDRCKSPLTAGHDCIPVLLERKRQRQQEMMALEEEIANLRVLLQENNQEENKG